MCLLGLCTCENPVLCALRLSFLIVFAGLVLCEMIMASYSTFFIEKFPLIWPNVLFAPGQGTNRARSQSQEA